MGKETKQSKEEEKKEPVDMILNLVVQLLQLRGTAHIAATRRAPLTRTQIVTHSVKFARRSPKITFVASSSLF